MTLTSHGFTIELDADDTGSGFDLLDRNGICFASEWCDGDTIEQAKESALSYANSERERSGKDGLCADVGDELARDEEPEVDDGGVEDIEAETDRIYADADHKLTGMMEEGEE